MAKPIHSMIRVLDEARSVDFYRRAFGMRVADRYVFDGFTLVYLVANTIMNVTTQDEQLAVFANAAAHLAPGGCFVVEVIVPQLRRVPAGESARVFTLDPDHVGIETFDDPVGQVTWSHHWMHVAGRLVRNSAPYRYVWPSELDLMGKLAGLRLRVRWAGWDRTPFTADSPSQVAVFDKPLSRIATRGKGRVPNTKARTSPAV